MTLIIPEPYAESHRAAERAAEAKLAAERRAKDIAKLTERCAIKDPNASGREAVRHLCGVLINAKWNSLTSAEVARLVSDALLGPGEDYEIKTELRPI